MYMHVCVNWLNNYFVTYVNAPGMPVVSKLYNARKHYSAYHCGIMLHTVSQYVCPIYIDKEISQKTDLTKNEEKATRHCNSNPRRISLRKTYSPSCLERFSYNREEPRQSSRFLILIKLISF